jgi:hypothetical protein
LAFSRSLERFWQRNKPVAANQFDGRQRGLKAVNFVVARPNRAVSKLTANIEKRRVGAAARNAEIPKTRTPNPFGLVIAAWISRDADNVGRAERREF